MNIDRLISVIIPTYNRIEYLKQTLDSVLEQTYQNIEVIIIDDGSTDNTREVILSNKDRRIKYIWQENSGLPALARNKGLNAARGEYVAFLDSDDLWLPAKLEKQMQAFDNNPGLLLVSTNGYYFRENYRKKMKSIITDKKISFRSLLRDNIIITSSVLMKSEVMKQIGLMDEDPRIKAAEDYDYWLRILNYRDNSALVLKDRFVMYRLHRNNLNKFGQISRQSERLRVIFSKYMNHEKQYIERILENHVKSEDRIESTIALYSGRISIKILLTEKEVSLPGKITIMAKYLIFRLFPYLRKYFKTELEEGQ